MSTTWTLVSESCSTYQTNIMLWSELRADFCVHACVYKGIHVSMLVWNIFLVLVKKIYIQSILMKYWKRRWEIFLLLNLQYNIKNSSVLFFPVWHFSEGWSNDTILAMAFVPVKWFSVECLFLSVWLVQASPPATPLCRDGGIHSPCLTSSGGISILHNSLYGSWRRKLQGLKV